MAIRIIGSVTPEKLEILKNADAIVREELDAYNATGEASEAAKEKIERANKRSAHKRLFPPMAKLPDNL